jgi:hypothetical protein
VIVKRNVFPACLPVLRPAILALALVSSGCASIESPDLPAGQYGTLEHADPGHSGILIDRVDDRWAGIRPAKVFQLGPGEHSLKARANLPFYTSTPQLLWFDVAPGGRYLIQTFSAKETGQWGFGIIDASSGARVDRLWSNAPTDPSKPKRTGHSSSPAR